MRLVEQSVQRDPSTKVSEFRTELPRACASGRSDSPRRAAIGRGISPGDMCVRISPLLRQFTQFNLSAGIDRRERLSQARARPQARTGCGCPWTGHRGRRPGREHP